MLLPGPPAPPKPTAPTSTVLIPSTASGADVEDDWDKGTVQEVMKAMGEVDPIPEPRYKGIQPTQKLQLSQLGTFAKGAAFPNSPSTFEPLCLNENDVAFCFSFSLRLLCASGRLR